MNYQTKLAAAMNDYQLGVKVASVSPLWDEVRATYIPASKPDMHTVTDMKLPNVLEALKLLKQDGKLREAAGQVVRHPHMQGLAAGTLAAAVAGGVGGVLRHRALQREAHKRQAILAGLLGAGALGAGAYAMRDE